MAKRGAGGGGNNGGGVDAAEELLLGAPLPLLEAPPPPSARRATTAGSTASTSVWIAAWALVLAGSVPCSISRLATSSPASMFRAAARLSYNATTSRFALAHGRRPGRVRPDSYKRCWAM